MGRIGLLEKRRSSNSGGQGFGNIISVVLEMTKNYVRSSV